MGHGKSAPCANTVDYSDYVILPHEVLHTVRSQGRAAEPPIEMLQAELYDHLAIVGEGVDDPYLVLCFLRLGQL